MGDHGAEVDVEMTVPITKKYLARYPNLYMIRFDRGYSAEKNGEALFSLPVHVPKKGRLSEAYPAHQSTPEFRCIQHRHPRVESRINCMEQHGGGCILSK